MERFWSKVDAGPADQCWLWTASTKSGGYGQFHLGGTTVYSHRLAYELLIGPIPVGMDLDHLCRNHGCVNPSHLEVVTHHENMRRGYYGRKTHCPAGHEYSPNNTRRSFGKRPGRHCIMCQRARDAA